MDIVIKHLNFAYADRPVFEDLSLTMKEGEITTIMGASGRGKTTLLQILTGQIKPQSGEVSGIDKAFPVGMVFQENRLCEEFSAALNVRIATGKDRETIRAHFQMVGIEDAMDQKVSELSGGMKRRVAIVRAMISDSCRLILDEPVKGLDADTKEQVLSYMKNQRQGRTMILVTHDRKEAEYFGGKIVNLS